MTTPGIPRSALRHRPMAPDVQEFVVLSKRSSRGKQQREPHTTGGPPSLGKHAPRHPLVLVGLGMLVTILLLWASLGVVAWSMRIADDLHYGFPRTTQVDHYVGHEQTRTPSHFTAMNLHGHISVLEIPGGNLRAAQLLVGPSLVGPGADLAPVTLTFFGDVHHPDLLVTVQSLQVRFHNTGKSFVPIG